MSCNDIVPLLAQNTHHIEWLNHSQHWFPMFSKFSHRQPWPETRVKLMQSWDQPGLITPERPAGLDFWVFKVPTDWGESKRRTTKVIIFVNVADIADIRMNLRDMLRLSEFAVNHPPIWGPILCPAKTRSVLDRFLVKGSPKKKRTRLEPRDVEAKLDFLGTILGLSWWYTYSIYITLHHVTLHYVTLTNLCIHYTTWQYITMHVLQHRFTYTRK